MAKVVVEVRKHQLGREESGVSFEVHASNGGSKLGDLVVSSGGLRWYPRSTRRPSFLRWGKFDEIAQEHGTMERD